MVSSAKRYKVCVVVVVVVARNKRRAQSNNNENKLDNIMFSALHENIRLILGKR